MYIRSKKVKGKLYYYLVEQEKVGDKLKQRMVAYLGNAEKIKKMHNFYKENKDRG